MELLKLDYPNLQALLFFVAGVHQACCVSEMGCAAVVHEVRHGRGIKELGMLDLFVFLALSPPFAKDTELVADGRYFRRRRRATTC